MGFVWGAGRAQGCYGFALMGTTALAVVMALQTPALAQTPPATAQQSQRSIAFSIPAQPLSSAVVAFSRAAGIDVASGGVLASDIRSGGVRGTMTAEQGLAALLAGTGYSFRFNGTRSITLVNTAAGLPETPGAFSDGDTIQLETIDVSGASGWAAAADLPFETPGSSAHISAEQIERVPPSTPGDMFKSTPGVIAVGNRVGPSMNLNIRGLQGQNRVNVMVDGTRQSNNSYRGYQGSRNEVYVDPDFIGGIDITKGPLGVAGGIGAMGGVVNMRTLEAGDIVKEGETFGARIKAGLRSNTISPSAPGTLDIRNKDSEDVFGDAWSGSVVAATQQDNYNVLLGFSRRKSGNYFAGTSGPETYLETTRWATRERKYSPFGHGGEVFGTSEDVTSFIAKGKTEWGEGHALEAGYIYYGNDCGELNETLLAFSVGTGLVIPASQPYISETKTHTLRTKYSYDPSDNDLIAFTSSLWMSDVDTSQYQSEKKIRTYGADASNRARIETAFGDFAVITGAEAVIEHADADNSGTSDISDLLTEPKGDRRMTGAFSRTTWNPRDWLTLEGGFRIDYYESTPDNPEYADKQDQRFSPSASITVSPIEGVQIFGSYVEGWRPPSLRETSAGEDSGYLIPNPDLDPEISKNFEFGMNFLRENFLLEGDLIRFKAVRFNNNYEDYIVRTRRPGGRYTWTNIERAEFDGYELSAAYDAGTAFIEAGFTKYDKAEFCRSGICTMDGVGEDYGIQNMPPEYSGNVTAGLRLLDRRFVLGVKSYFFSERFGGYAQAPDSIVAPVRYTSNVIVDVFGSYEFNEHARLDFSVENIGDRYYIDPLATGVVPSPGRTFRAGLTAKF